MGPLQHDDAPYVSTGQLPSPEQVRRAVDEAYERYRAAAGGERSRIYPALARVPADLFGLWQQRHRGALRRRALTPLGSHSFGVRPRPSGSSTIVGGGGTLGMGGDREW
jgi:hypothetical protein